MMSKTIDELIKKAENNDWTGPHPRAAFRGEEAKEASERIVEKYSGRPNLGSDHAQNKGRSPRRQVRLPEDVDNRLNEYAREHETTPSQVMRDAIEAYLV